MRNKDRYGRNRSRQLLCTQKVDLGGPHLMAERPSPALLDVGLAVVQPAKNHSDYPKNTYGMLG